MTCSWTMLWLPRPASCLRGRTCRSCFPVHIARFLSVLTHMYPYVSYDHIWPICFRCSFAHRRNLQIRTHGLLSSDAELASLLVGPDPGGSQDWLPPKDRCGMSVSQRYTTSANVKKQDIKLRIISGSVMVSSSHVPRVCRLQASYAMQVIGFAPRDFFLSLLPHITEAAKQLQWNSIVMMCDVFLPRRQGRSHSKGSWQGWIAGIIAGICLESAEQVLGSVCLPLKWLCICNYSTGWIFDMWCLMMSRFLQLSGRVVNRRFETRNMVSTQRISAPRHRNSKMTWYQKDPAMAQFLVMKWAVFGQTLHWISRHRLIILSNHHGCHLTVSKRNMPATMCFFLGCLVIE